MAQRLVRLVDTELALPSTRTHGGRLAGTPTTVTRVGARGSTVIPVATLASGSSSSTSTSLPIATIPSLGLYDGLRATLDGVTFLVAVVTLDARPVLWLRALFCRVAVLVAVAALEDPLVGAVLRAVAVLATVAAEFRGTIWAITREVTHCCCKVSSRSSQTRSEAVYILLPQFLHSTFSGFGGSGHSLAI